MKYVTITMPILQMRNLKYTDDKQHVQGLPAGIWTQAVWVQNPHFNHRENRA